MHDTCDTKTAVSAHLVEWTAEVDPARCEQRCLKHGCHSQGSDGRSCIGSSPCLWPQKPAAQATISRTHIPASAAPTHPTGALQSEDANPTCRHSRDAADCWTARPTRGSGCMWKPMGHEVCHNQGRGTCTRRPWTACPNQACIQTAWQRCTASGCRMAQPRWTWMR